MSRSLISDRLAEKRRPAVIVSGEAVARAGFVWIVMITSARNASIEDDIPIQDFAAAGLTVPSVIRPVKMTCIEPSRILRKVGTLPPSMLDELCKRIRGMVGTDRSPA